jgi:uncharacterized repeat protein (TIGR01451 family)
MVFGSCVTSVSGAFVEPTPIEGNNPNIEGYVMFKEDENGRDIDSSDTYTDGTATVTVTFSEDNKFVDWVSDIPISYVFIKGGQGGDGYMYRYDTAVLSDSQLRAPDNNNDQAEISHVTFYYIENDEEPEPATLTVRKVLVGNDGETEIIGNAKEFTINIWRGDEKVETCELKGGVEATFELEPGEYMIEEDEELVPPYSFEGMYIDNQEIEDGVFTIGENDVTVTVVNKKVIDEQSAGTLLIRKVVQELTEADGWVSVDDDTTFLVNVSRTPAGEPIHDNPIEVAVGQNATIGDLSYGTYYITEVTPTSKYTIYDGEEDEYYDTVTLSSENQSATATIVNRITPTLEETGTVTFIKELVNENGEAIVTREPSFKIKLTDSDNQSQIFNVPAGTPYTTAVLPLGTYKAEEIEIPNGYEYVSISHESFDLTKDGFTITIKNKKLNDNPPPATKGTIIVKKVILDKNEHINTTETREFVIRVKKNSETDNYVDFTLKNGELEKRGQFDLGEYVISELDLPADYDVYFSLSTDTDEDGKVDLNNDGDTVTVTVTNMQKDTPSIPTISKDDGGVRVYPGDTITYEIEVDLKDIYSNRAFILETPDLNTEYIGGNEWQLHNTDESGRKTYRYNLVPESPNLMASDFEAAPEVPDFKVRVKATTPRSVVLVTNSATLYYYDDDRHVTVLEDTPILHRNVDDDDDDDKDDEEKNDPPKVGKPDLVVTKTDNGTMISPGALVEYFITVENKGTAPAEGVKIYETVPVGSEFVASSNQGWVLEGGKYVYNLGLLNVGDKKEVKYVLKANNPFPTDIVKIINEVEVKDNGTETATTDNKASDDTPILTSVPVIAEPPVVIQPVPELPIPDEVVTPPTSQIPDLPFTGGTAEVELVFTGMGILLMAGGIALKKRR